MRKFALTVLATCLVSISASSVQAAVIPLIDLKASDYNASTGIWTDSSGNSNNANPIALVNTPSLVTGATPSGASVVHFDGSDALQLTTGLSSTDFTVLTFLRPAGNPNDSKTIIGGEGGSMQYRISGDGATNEQEILRRGQANLGHSSTALSTTDFSNINVTINGSDGAFRLNGAADGTSGGSGGFTTPSIMIGAATSTGAPNEVFAGDIAEIQVYGSVLTSDQIQTIEAAYNAAYAVPEPATIGLLSFGALGLLLAARRRRTTG